VYVCGWMVDACHQGYTHFVGGTWPRPKSNRRVKGKLQPCLGHNECRVVEYSSLYEQVKKYLEPFHRKKK